MNCLDQADFGIHDADDNKPREPGSIRLAGMSTRLVTLCFDANNPLRVARFWAAALRWEIDDETEEEIGLVPTDGTPLPFLFLPVPEPKAGKNRLHLDLVSESPEHQSEMVDRLITLGAQPIDIGQGDASWVVMADPEGNEFCLLRRRLDAQP